MKQYLNGEQPEDELVRIEAESIDLIIMGFLHGQLDMPNNVVPLSKAIQTMDAFSKEVTEYWDLDGEDIFYYVYACKDDFFLFSYMNGKICSDHRQDERPKSPERVYLRLMEGGKTPPQLICRDKRVYAEWAERELKERWADVMENLDIYQGWDSESQKWINVCPEDMFFDVYGDEEGTDYRYSYRDGKTYIRPRSEEEETKKSACEDKEVEKKATTYDSLPFMKKREA